MTSKYDSPLFEELSGFDGSAAGSLYLNNLFYLKNHSDKEVVIKFKPKHIAPSQIDANRPYDYDKGGFSFYSENPTREFNRSTNTMSVTLAPDLAESNMASAPLNYFRGDYYNQVYVVINAGGEEQLDIVNPPMGERGAADYILAQLGLARQYESVLIYTGEGSITLPVESYEDDELPMFANPFETRTNGYERNTNNPGIDNVNNTITLSKGKVEYECGVSIYLDEANIEGGYSNHRLGFALSGPDSDVPMKVVLTPADGDIFSGIGDALGGLIKPKLLADYPDRADEINKMLDGFLITVNKYFYYNDEPHNMISIVFNARQGNAGMYDNPYIIKIYPEEQFTSPDGAVTNAGKLNAIHMAGYLPEVHNVYRAISFGTW